MSDVDEQLDALRQLSSGWDGYNGEAPSEETIKKAKVVAQLFRDFNLYAVPGSDGSIQLESHTLDYDLEINIEPVRTTEAEG